MPVACLTPPPQPAGVALVTLIKAATRIVFSLRRRSAGHYPVFLLTPGSRLLAPAGYQRGASERTE